MWHGGLPCVIIFAYAFERLIILQSGVVCDCGNHVRKVNPVEVSVVVTA
jgi:hypothetical protein